MSRLRSRKQPCTDSVLDEHQPVWGSTKLIPPKRIAGGTARQARRGDWVNSYEEDNKDGEAIRATLGAMPAVLR